MNIDELILSNIIYSMEQVIKVANSGIMIARSESPCYEFSQYEREDMASVSYAEESLAALKAAISAAQDAEYDAETTALLDELAGKWSSASQDAAE